ncbi:thioredoxin domain-containing protein [Marinibacterium profundimaris]|uniref:hypothetical protein n=1 Tax=Marinibacterium profundimaris TaxID=1679460 RepID=UPI001E559B76|nr:hypothetical protein [Marinibacterium profundimaris]
MARLLVAALLAALSAPGWADVALLMGEEKGCPWCARWHAEIGDAYARTSEGRAAPLMRYDVHRPLPDGVTLSKPVFFTPTFVLLMDGAEVARLEGYPGEDFFWGLLGQMLADANVQFVDTQDD